VAFSRSKRWNPVSTLPNVSIGIAQARSNVTSRINSCDARSRSPERSKTTGNNAARPTPTANVTTPATQRSQNDVATVARTRSRSPRECHSAMYFTVAAPKPNSSSGRYQTSEPTSAQMPYSSLPSPCTSTGVITSATTIEATVMA
jgi:hypothetical protein